MKQFLFIFSAFALIVSSFAACTQDRIGNTNGFPISLQPVETLPGQYYYNWLNPCSGTAPFLVGAEASMCSTVSAESPLVQLNSLTQVTVSSSFGGLLNVIVYCGTDKPKTKPLGG